MFVTWSTLLVSLGSSSVSPAGLLVLETQAQHQTLLALNTGISITLVLSCDVHTNNESMRNIEPFLVTKAGIWKTDRIDLVCDGFLVYALVNAPGREVKRSIKFDEGNVIRDVVVCQENIFIYHFSLSHLPCHNLSEPQSSGSSGTWEHFC